MADLSVKFIGLQLKNPIIAASSGLTSTKEGVRRAAEAGAGAIVLKSLFEEQLRAEISTLTDASEYHPEAEAFLAGLGMSEGSGEYCELIKLAKRETDIPVIASLNCSGNAAWAKFAALLEGAGADAIELNLGVIPTDPTLSASAIEDKLVSLVGSVVKAVKIPVCSKLGSAYTNVGNLGSRLAKAGSRGLTLFNRFYRMDVDLESMSLSSGPMRGSPEAYHESLRWISLLEGRVGAELCASGGVYDGQTALRLMAAGAGAVQLCSAMYANGYGIIGSALRDMTEWLDAHNVARVADIRGRLARRNSAHPERYGRLHYVKALTGQA